MEIQILSMRHILDQIMRHLSIYDYINLLVALKLEKEYTLRELDILQNQNPDELLLPLTSWKLRNLLEIAIPYFTPNEIRAHFNLIWEHARLSTLDEHFFIENYNLIDHKKLLYLKYECENFIFFSKNFHNRFPTFNTLKVCSNFLDCQTEIFEGQMCSNCYINKCPRCDYVMLPKLILNSRHCESCNGCPQYDDDLWAS